MSSDSHHGNKFISHLFISVLILKISVVDFLPKYSNITHSSTVIPFSGGNLGVEETSLENLHCKTMYVRTLFLGVYMY